MTFDYAHIVCMACKCIERYGQTVTIKRGSAEHSAKGLRQKISMQDRDGTLVKEGDSQVLVAASGLGIEPTTADKLKFADSTVWRQVVSVEAIKPGPMAVAYKLGIRD